MPPKAGIQIIWPLLLVLSLSPSLASGGEKKAKRNDALRGHFTAPASLFSPGIERIGTEIEVPIRFGGAIKDLQLLTVRVHDPIYEIVSAVGPASWSTQLPPASVKREVRYRPPIGSVGSADLRLKLKRRERQADEPWMTLEKERKVRAYSVEEVERQAKDLGLYDIEIHIEVGRTTGEPESTTLHVEIR